MHNGTWVQPIKTFCNVLISQGYFASEKKFHTRCWSINYAERKMTSVDLFSYGLLQNTWMIFVDFLSRSFWEKLLISVRTERFSCPRLHLWSRCLIVRERYGRTINNIDRMTVHASSIVPRIELCYLLTSLTHVMSMGELWKACQIGETRDKWS